MRPQIIRPDGLPDDEALALSRLFDPADTGPYISLRPILAWGRWLVVWPIAGGRPRPRLWSDFWRALPPAVVTYPALRRVDPRALAGILRWAERP